jgi:hypothetical protein
MIIIVFVIGLMSAISLDQVVCVWCASSTPSVSDSAGHQPTGASS